MTETTRIGAEVPRTFHTHLTALAGRLTNERGKRVDLADLIREALTHYIGHVENDPASVGLPEKE